MKNEENFTLNGINFKLINTDKYKTIKGIVSFVREVNVEDFPNYALLGRLIASATNTYKTKKELSNKMFELYDSSCYLYTSYSYKIANSSFLFSTIDGKLVNDNSIFKNTIALLKDVMFNPLADNDGFDEHSFQEEKKALENQIRNIYNDKSRYCYKKMLEAMAPNSIISSSTYGTLESLNKITRKSLLDFYNKLLTTSFVTVGIIGNITKEEVIENFKDFNLVQNKVNIEISPSNLIFKDKPLEIQEKQNIIQAKYSMGFRCDIDFKSPLYAPLLVFNSMFGGMFGSTLFTIIREKNSLCYDIQSEPIVSKKLFLISCGLDPKNLALTKQIVLEELQKYKEGNIDSNLLEVSKNTLINELLQMEDQATNYLSFKLESVINNRESIEEIIDKIKKTKIEDIIKVSNLIIPDTFYSLVPGEENE